MAWVRAPDNSYALAPWGLWIFGERGYKELDIYLIPYSCNPSADYYQRRFPEATIVPHELSMVP